MPYWLFKTEPSSYSLDDLARDRKTKWDGVSNAMALIHLRNVRKGDRILLYHTGSEKSVVGIMKASANPKTDGKEVSVEIEFEQRLATPIPLAVIRIQPAFADWELVRNSRLSVMPVSPEIWRSIEQLAGN